MKYFTLGIHQDYTPPRLTKWHGILDPKTLNEKKRNLIPKYTIFQVEHHMQTVFTDLIFHPCFMVSETMMWTMKLYEPSFRFERIVLADQEAKKVGTYYIPRLEKLDVLTSNSRLGRDKRSLEHIEIDGEKTKGKAIFQIEHDGKMTILIHVNLAESLLRRKVIGIDLKEVDVI